MYVCCHNQTKIVTKIRHKNLTSYQDTYHWQPFLGACFHGNQCWESILNNMPTSETKTYFMFCNLRIIMKEEIVFLMFFIKKKNYEYLENHVYLS